MNICLLFKPSRGFTIVQTLATVAVIGILATLVFGGLGEARKKSRDAQRYADLNSVRLSLRLYKETFGVYPTTGGSWRTVCTNGANTTAYTTSGSQGYIPSLAPDYMPVLPTDPMGCAGPGPYHGYMYRSDGTNYKFVTDWTAERGERCKSGGEFVDPARVGSQSTYAPYHACAVYTSGASGW